MQADQSRVYPRDRKTLLFALTTNDHVSNSWDLLKPSFITIPVTTFAVFPQNHEIFGIVQDYQILINPIILFAASHSLLRGTHHTNIFSMD